MVARDNRLGPAQIDNDVAVFNPLDHTGDNFTNPVLELFVLALALGAPHLLHNHLLGGLGGNAAVINGRQGLGDKFSHLGLRLVLAHFVERDFGADVFDLFHHLTDAEQPQVAVFAIDLGADVVFHAVTGLGRLLNGFLHGLDHDFLVDCLFPGDRFRDLQDFQFVSSNCQRHDRTP